MERVESKGPNDYPAWPDMVKYCAAHRDRLSPKDKTFIDDASKWPAHGPSFRQWQWLVDIYVRIEPTELMPDEELGEYIRKKLGA